MAFNDIEAARIRKIVSSYVEANRPPPHIRPELDLSFRLDGQSVELFEVRPVWQGEPDETMEVPVAKATFVKASSTWRVYWMRADLKWHRYEPFPSAVSIQQFLDVVDADVFRCFHG